jgi:hypothetical protein
MDMYHLVSEELDLEVLEVMVLVDQIVLEVVAEVLEFTLGLQVFTVVRKDLSRDLLEASMTASLPLQYLQFPARAVHSHHQEQASAEHTEVTVLADLEEALLTESEPLAVLKVHAVKDHFQDRTEAFTTVNQHHPFLQFLGIMGLDM